MTRSSGQHRMVFAGQLVCPCGFFGTVDWEYDVEVDPSATYTDCPECDAEVMQATSEGNF